MENVIEALEKAALLAESVGNEMNQIAFDDREDTSDVAGSVIASGIRAMIQEIGGEVPSSALKEYADHKDALAKRREDAAKRKAEYDGLPVAYIEYRGQEVISTKRQDGGFAQSHRFKSAEGTVRHEGTITVLMNDGNEKTYRAIPLSKSD